MGEFHINFTCYSTLCESSPVSCILRHDTRTMVVSDLKQLFLRSHVLFQSHCLVVIIPQTLSVHHFSTSHTNLLKE